MNSRSSLRTVEANVSRQFIQEAIAEKLYHYKVVPLQDKITNISLGEQSLEEILNGPEGTFPAKISVVSERGVRITRDHG